MWIEFVVGSCPCFNGFSTGTLVFLTSQKQTFPNSNPTWKQWTIKEPHCGCATEIPIYLLYLFKWQNDDALRLQLRTQSLKGYLYSEDQIL